VIFEEKKLRELFFSRRDSPKHVLGKENVTFSVVVN